VRFIESSSRPLIAVAFVLLCPGAAPGQFARQAQDGTITIHAAEAPLGAVLRQLAEIQRFDRIAISADVEDRAVTLVLENVDVRAALLAVLKSAGVDYVMAIGKDGASLRLVVTDVPESASSREERPVLKEVPLNPPAHDGSADILDDAKPEATDDARVAELERALGQPRMERAPGTVVELPFPDTTGQPLLAVTGDANAKTAVPFPVPAAAGPATQRRPAVNPAVTDPKLQELLEGLSAAPKR
jgi:hypothetical protein